VAAAPTIHYDLVDLFKDQPEWFGRETVPHLLAWLRDVRSPATFRLQRADAPETRLELRWTTASLTPHIPRLDEEVRRLVEGRSVQVEQIPQYGAYALAGVVASAVLQRRVVSLRVWQPPDLLFDDAPGSLRGIEVAGRSSKGLAGLRKLAAEKTADLHAIYTGGRPDGDCGRPTLSRVLGSPPA
jgi:hypothetical protein